MHNLIKTNEFYDTIDLIITPVILANNATVAQYVNKAFLSQIGYQAADIPDQDSWFNKVHPDEKYRVEVQKNWERRLDAAKRTGDTHVHMVTKVRCADGSYKWYDIHESVFGNTKVITFLDVNDLQESNEDLTEVLRQKDILMAIIAHDVRSPLGNLRQIVSSYEKLDLSQEEVRELFSGIGTQIDYVFNIINSLLVRTGTDKGNFVEKYEEISLSDFFSKYLEYYQEKLDKQQISLVFELTDDAVLSYDPFILDVICRNLIDNAIKFTRAHGSIYITFEKTAHGGEVVIRDTGEGMPAAQIDRILKNKGGRQSRNMVTDGFGMGLVMAKEILEKHSGKLSIKSELGKGTSFIINISNI